MRGFVGIGHAENIEEAVNEATAGLKNADLLVLLAPFDAAEQAADLLSQKYPAVPMIGTCGNSVGKSDIEDRQIVVVGFAGVTVSCGLIKDIRTAPVMYVKQFEDNLKSIDASSANTICMEFLTGAEDKVLSTLGSVLNRYDIPLAGGSSYGVPLGEKHIVIYNGKIYSRSCVYAFIKNNAGKIKLFCENIYEKMNKRPHYATLVDVNTKSLFQLDGTPAYEVYSEETGCDKDNIVSNMPKNPLGRALGDDIYISATQSLDMNGVMFNGKSLYENDSVYIMQLGDYQQIHKEMLDTIKASTNRISFIFAFDCVNRLRLFAENDYLSDYIDSMSCLGNYAALISNGQQYNNQHCNQTLVCAVFE